MIERRRFLKTMTAAAVPMVTGIVNSPAAFEASEKRFGDLLVRQQATDHFELQFTPKVPRALRLLQITDTHFHPGDDSTRATEAMLKNLVEREQPDLIVHTGDFVNNDSKQLVEWTGMDVIDGLERPWALCFGNHDYPVHNAPGSLPLDDIRQKMRNGFQGYIDAASGRHYCYRHDVYSGDAARPAVCLFFFQVGYAEGDRRISDPQLLWFAQQMEKDAAREVNAPISVFVHIPLLEYHSLYESGRAVGTKAEDVCYDSDKGQSFQAFRKSGRVTGVFCGHDHVNNYHGDWQGMDLTYGRVTGLGAYGPPEWTRGGRLLSLDLQSAKTIPQHLEVF